MKKQHVYPITSANILQNILPICDGQINCIVKRKYLTFNENLFLRTIFVDLSLIILPILL